MAGTNKHLVAGLRRHLAHVAAVAVLLLCSSCARGPAETLERSSDLRLDVSLSSECNDEGKVVIKTDLMFTNTTDQPLDIYFPPKWGRYGGLSFLAYDEDNVPLDLLNLFHGIPLPVAEESYKKVTTRLLPHHHVILTTPEPIGEEYRHPERMRYAEVVYFSPLPSSLFASQPHFWRGGRLVTERVPISVKPCVVQESTPGE
jgi:hypothetical protein